MIEIARLAKVVVVVALTPTVSVAQDQRLFTQPLGAADASSLNSITVWRCAGFYQSIMTTVLTEKEDGEIWHEIDAARLNFIAAGFALESIDYDAAKNTVAEYVALASNFYEQVMSESYLKTGEHITTNAGLISDFEFCRDLNALIQVK